MTNILSLDIKHLGYLVFQIDALFTPGAFSTFTLSLVPLPSGPVLPKGEGANYNNEYKPAKMYENADELENNDKRLHPNYVTGFVDGEGSFIIEFQNLEVVLPKFSIELHKKDLLLLKQIQKFFNGIGTITLNKNRNSAVFRVFKLKDLTNIVIPHFIKYSLITQKKADFELFRLVIKLINHGEHLTNEGIRKILTFFSFFFFFLFKKKKTIKIKNLYPFLLRRGDIYIYIK
jgi:hypothetical protein